MSLPLLLDYVEGMLSDTETIDFQEFQQLLRSLNNTFAPSIPERQLIQVFDMVNLPEDLVNRGQESRGELLFYCNDSPVYSLKPSVELKDLEQLSAMAVAYSFLRQYSSDPQDYSIKQNAMNRLRSLFNMEFKMRCHECGKVHYQDEISAPER